MTFQLYNCSCCGQLLTSNRGFQRLCPACSSNQLEQSRRVKEYIRSHPRASILQVYTETGIPLQTIKSLMKS